MSALLRGLNEGLQTGLRLGGTLRDARQRRALADESARFNVTEGAYGEDLQQNIQQLEGLRAQDPEQAAAYSQAIDELQRRSQMTAPDFSIASGPQAFGTREEATRAARPMRAEGLANVYERFGDIEQAEAARERADTARLRASQIRKTEREDEQLGKLDKVNTQSAEWLNKRLTGEDGQRREPTLEDSMAAAQHRVSLLTSEGLGDQAAAATDQFLSMAARQITVQNAARDQAIGQVASALQAGDLTPLADFYNRFVPDGATVTGVKQDPKTGQITVSRQLLDGTKVQDAVVGTREQILASVIGMADPKEVLVQAQRMFDNNIKTQQLGLDVQRTKSQLARDAAAIADRKTTLEKTVDALRGYGINPTDAQIQALAGIKEEGMSPEGKARLEVLMEQSKNITPGSKAAENLDSQLTDLFNQERVRIRDTKIVSGLRASARNNDLDTAFAELRSLGFSDGVITNFARQAGVTYTPAAAPTPAAPGSAAAGVPAAETSAAPAGPGLVRTVQDAASGASPAQLATIRNKIANRMPLSGVEQIIAQRNGLIPAR
jgi:hypothetical protein